MSEQANQETDTPTLAELAKPQEAVEVPASVESVDDTESQSLEEVPLSIADGVTQKVKLSELEELWRTRDAAQESERAAQRMLEEVAQLKSAYESIRELPDERRAAVLRGLQQAATTDGQRDDSRPPSRQQAPAPENSVLQQMQAELAELRGYVGRKAQEEAQQSLATNVEREMATLSVFAEKPSIASYARQSILTELGANPNADVRSVVQRHAAEAHKVLGGLNVAPPPRDPRGRITPDQTFSGTDLENGSVRRRLLDQFRDGLT